MSHPPALVVHDRLADFVCAIHNKRAATNDRFVNWFATEQQYSCVLRAVYVDVVAFLIKYTHFSWADGFCICQSASNTFH